MKSGSDTCASTDDVRTVDRSRHESPVDDHVAVRIDLFAFEYYDPARDRWIRARYKAPREVIVERYSRHRILGDPEVRQVEDDPALRFPTRPSHEPAQSHPRR